MLFRCDNAFCIKMSPSLLFPRRLMGIQVFGRMSGVPAIVMVIKFVCLLYGYSSLFNRSPPSSFLQQATGNATIQQYP